MIKQLVFAFLLLLIIIPAGGQMVYTDPAIPSPGKPVKIYFNSSYQDNGNLQYYTGDLYAHTGVTVKTTTGETSWAHVIGTWGDNARQPKLTYLGNYLYELNITPDINTFYSCLVNETVTKICLVLRSADVSKQTRPDIFIPVYLLNLNTVFVLPEKTSIVAELNEQIPVKAAATLADSVSLYLNGNYIKSGENTDLITDTIIADQYGEFWIKSIAWDLPYHSADSFFVYVREPVVTESIPAGMDDGINYTSNNSVTLVLHAPNKEYVFALGDFTGWRACKNGYMKRTPDNERYWIEIDDLQPGKEYRFQYQVDSALYIADPYADKQLDPWNDSYITNETYPDLISYPKDTASGIVSVLQTAQVPYPWETTAYDAPDKSGLIIYELLIRDFLAKHDFKTLIDTLSYLDDLGINAVELMPVTEFEGNLSWGYNPSFYFAPDKYYGPKNDMKAFVDSCHARGISVIMDIVLNHCFGQSPFVQLYLDHYGTDQIFMKIPNPWFNVGSPNPSYKWGADFNHESIATQNLVDRITSYWLTEYKIDGFRFDFSKGFTNTSGDGYAYDASRIAILKRMASQIWSVNPEAFVILEHFTDNTEEKELADYGMLIWGNSNYNFAEAAMGYTSDLTGASYLGRGWTVPGLVTYMESHDEERIMFKTLTYGAGTTSYSTKDFETALKRMQLNTLFFLSIPGPKMIWQFGELGYDVSIDAGGRTSEKPIKWEYLTDRGRFKLYMLYRTMNALRKTQPVFTTNSFDWMLSSPFKQIRLNGTDNKINILGNFGITATTNNSNFQQTGKWYEFFSGDSIDITNTSANMSFQPGEYRLYSTKKLPSVAILTDIEDIYNHEPEKFVSVYPNPSGEVFNFLIENDGPSLVSITIFDISGRIIKHIDTEITDSTIPVRWDGRSANGSEAPAGFYVAQIRSAKRTGTIKIIKN